MKNKQKTKQEEKKKIKTNARQYFYFLFKYVVIFFFYRYERSDNDGKGKLSFLSFYALLKTGAYFHNKVLLLNAALLFLFIGNTIRQISAH